MKIDKITNIARGSQKYRHLRRKILQTAALGSSIRLNKFLTTSLLSLDREAFATYTFDESDWRLLSKTVYSPSAALEADYLGLWIDYIVENKEWLTELSKFSSEIDHFGLTDDSEGLIQAISKLSLESSQSLFAMKAIAAVAVNIPDFVSTYFTKNLRSEWLREVFVDGLVASTATTISNRNFQDAAEFMLSNLRWKPERQVIRYLLRPELASENQLLHAYVALVSHPFDALQLLVVELERLCANGGNPPNYLTKKLEHICDLEGPLGARLKAILAILDGREVDIVARKDKVAEFFRVATSQTAEFTDIDKYSDDGLAKAIIHCSQEIVPDPEMWNRLYIFSIHWGFSDVGRFVRTFLHILYLTNREQHSEEFVLNLSSLHLRGEFDEVISSAPSGIEFLKKTLSVTKFQGALESAGELIQEPSKYTNRFHMCALHWRLQLLEREVRPVEWMSYVLGEIPIRPDYLSGLNWSWLDEIVGVYRVSHFAKAEETRLAYIYCFLVSLSEDHNRDPVAIRTMIKKLELSNCEALLSYVREKAGDDFAAGLVRYYLSTSEILHLGYASNPAAANLQRISALDFVRKYCVEQTIISLDYYETEAAVLQKSLFSQEINRGQFEFPWHRIQADARSDFQDYFKTARELLVSGEGKKVLGEAISSLDHSFTNKQSASYRVKNYQRQIASVVLSFIDEILKQPSFGLEAILSSRFRHDTLERVFRNSAGELTTTDAIRLPAIVKAEMHDYFWPQVSHTLNTWISSKLHSARKSTPLGMFDIVPSQADLDELLAETLQAEEFDEAFTISKNWIIKRLSEQLNVVRTEFSGSLNRDVKTTVVQATGNIPDSVNFNELDTRAYRRALLAAMEHCIADTVSWFAIPEQEAQGDFVLPEAIEVAKQVCDVGTNEFPSVFSDIRSFSADIKKSALYTFVDVFANAKKHAENKKVRVTRLGNTVVFSNRSDSEVWTRSVDAHNHDALFSEGDSGLTKIAAGMYALRGKPVTVGAVNRNDTFHLILPLEGLAKQ